MITINKKREIFKKYAFENNLWLTDGIKYGVDYLLYNDNPSVVHSKYGVIIYNSMTYKELIAYQRICGSNNKILLIININEEHEIEIMECERFLLKPN